MKLKPVFTIQDLILKKQNKIDDLFDSKAVITHFLHNYKNGLKKHFQKDALTSIKKMLEYKENNEDITLELDDVIQQFLLNFKNLISK